MEGCDFRPRGDQSCRLIAFLMMDGARHFLNHHHAAQGHYRSVAAPADRLRARRERLSMAVRMGDFTNVAGGFPIEVDGEVIGAVTAGGAKIEQDVEVAKAALAALNL